MAVLDILEDSNIITSCRNCSTNYFQDRVLACGSLISANHMCMHCVGMECWVQVLYYPWSICIQSLEKCQQADWCPATSNRLDTCIITSPCRKLGMIYLIHGNLSLRRLIGNTDNVVNSHNYLQEWTVSLRKQKGSIIILTTLGNCSLAYWGQVISRIPSNVMRENFDVRKCWYPVCFEELPERCLGWGWNKGGVCLLMGMP